MIKKIELANIIGTAIRQVQGKGAKEIKSQIADALSAADIAHIITDTTAGGFVVHAGEHTFQVQPFYMPARIELPVVREPELLVRPAGKSMSRPAHAQREFRRMQDNKYKAMQNYKKSHLK